MKEITGPVIGVALVLASVFVPTAFIPGITGRLYQQFAVTIAVSVIISAFNALTLSPAPLRLTAAAARETKGPTGKFFAWFNHFFFRATEMYVRISMKFIRRSGITLSCRSCSVCSPSVVVITFRPVFYRTRIKDSSMLICSCRTPLPCSERTRSVGN